MRRNILLILILFVSIPLVSSHFSGTFPVRAVAVVRADDGHTGMGNCPSGQTCANAQAAQPVPSNQVRLSNPANRGALIPRSLLELIFAIIRAL
ncbi:MAG: hypothetical protein ACREDR_34020 [Blastocatellia bacterium]